MFDSISSESQSIKDLVKKVLNYHFDYVLTKPIPDKTKINQVMAWIEDLVEKDPKIEEDGLK